MAHPINFPGSNTVMNPPVGKEDAVVPAPAYVHGPICIVAIKLDPAEQLEIAQTGIVWTSFLMGGGMPPFYSGGQANVAGIAQVVGGDLPLYDADALRPAHDATFMTKYLQKSAQVAEKSRVISTLERRHEQLMAWITIALNGLNSGEYTVGLLLAELAKISENVKSGKKESPDNAT